MPTHIPDGLMFPIKLGLGRLGRGREGEGVEKLISKVVFKGEFLSSALDF